ncbi:AfsR/SARP family transcriptional regulator [Agromyces albus]|uniref:AfsR/SARP family transcriptional regulator n=1 Tax=Agromyces albus TaxID=205332 RepID=UPI0027866DFC|nr:BTAD domain-containing putative transcriptional regulator [Agromyces albus]MDQ0575805.1 DNA-binding SARP family transcriptional activator/energy-coupling factor transporter ATP-binding protein EcfA2 [Agromyces albus]
MSINVLGALSTDAGALSPQERAVVAALAVNPGHEMSPGNLAEACWGESVPRTWPKQVQALVSRVRRRLGPQSIMTTTQGYALSVAPETIDSVRFERLVDRAREQQGQGDPERAITRYEQALALWRGPPFSDVAAWPPASIGAARLDEIRRAAEEDLLEAHLACGEHHSVIAEAERLVRAEPLSERRWAILALALYRSGRQADALAALRRMRDELDSRLGVDPGPESTSLETQILRQDPRLDAPPPLREARAANPYKGLRPFTPDDAADYFGREPEIAIVLDRLDEAHLVAVVGPSGSGKSSLVLAGVVPRLRDRGRSPVLITPGTGRRTGDIVIIDQFEELFQLGWPPGDIAAYCESVADVVAAGHDVILTLRSDALDRCVADPRLGPLIREGLVVLGPPSAEALRSAIVEPARFSGLRVEHGLTELILRDAVNEPGVLPLLSHALAETWQRREGAVLTVEAYESVGGIRGAIARSAEELYAALAPAERTQCQALLRRLVSLTPDGRAVPRRVAVGPLRSEPHRSAIIARLASARLVSVTDETITVAHESLATAWPRLHSWLEEDAEGARTLAHLTAAAESWEEAGRPADELYRGARLRTALEWRDSSSPDLTATESAFLDTSAERESADEHRTAERARRERRQRRLRRILLHGRARRCVGRRDRPRRARRRRRGTATRVSGHREVGRDLAVAAVIAAHGRSAPRRRGAHPLARGPADSHRPHGHVHGVPRVARDSHHRRHRADRRPHGPRNGRSRRHARRRNCGDLRDRDGATAP